jgi:hypothetical protein
MEEIDTAIRSKFTALVNGNPNSLYTAINGKMYNEGAPLETKNPFVSFHEISDMYEPTFREELENVLIQFNIYADTITEVNTLCGYLKTLYDNCSLTVNGYNHLYMRREQSYKKRIDNYFAIISEYMIMVKNN